MSAERRGIESQGDREKRQNHGLPPRRHTTSLKCVEPKEAHRQVRTSMSEAIYVRARPPSGAASL